VLVQRARLERRQKVVGRRRRRQRRRQERGRAVRRRCIGGRFASSVAIGHGRRTSGPRLMMVLLAGRTVVSPVIGLTATAS
jgi:hypothetical protein